MWPGRLSSDYKSSLFPSLPYLLVNLICSGILFGVVIGYFFLEETLRTKDTVWYEDKDELRPSVILTLVVASEVTIIPMRTSAQNRTALSIKCNSIKAKNGTSIQMGPFGKIQFPRKLRNFVLWCLSLIRASISIITGL